MEKIYTALHITHNDSDAFGCDVLLKAYLCKLNFRTIYGLAGKGDEAFKKLWYEYFEVPEEDQIDNIVLDTMNKLSEKPCSFLKSFRHSQYMEKISSLKFIFITDLSISETLSEDLLEFVKMIYDEMSHEIFVFGIDHHASNTMNKVEPNLFTVMESTYLDGVYDGLSPREITPDMCTLVSASFLTYHFLSNNSNIVSQYSTSFGINVIKKNILHWMACLISEYDTWVWKNNPGALVNHALAYSMGHLLKVNHKCVTPDTFKKVIDIIGIEAAVETMLDFINESNKANTKDVQEIELIPDLFKNIERVNSMQEELTVKKFMESHKVHIIDKPHSEYIYAYIINESQFSNRICEEVYKKYDFVDIVVVLYPNTKTLGFRTKKDDINLTRYVTRKYDGGGHKKAAGCHISSVEMIDMLADYYDAPSVHQYIKDNNIVI